VSTANTLSTASQIVHGTATHSIIDAVVVAQTSTWGWGIGAAAVISLVVNYIDHRAKTRALHETYQNEVAAKLGKSPSQVTGQDLELVANGIPERGIAGNSVLAEELQKLKADRNLGFLTSVISVGVAMLIFGGLLMATAPAGAALAASPLVAHAASGISIFSSWGAFGIAALRAGIGFACHKALEEPIRWVGERILGMDNISSHERIEDLAIEREAGKSLSKEQILGVFIGANKQLEQFVQQKFGKEYEHLALPQKQEILQSFEQFIPVTAVTEAINSGRVKVTELAFSAAGQKSGVAPLDNPAPPKATVAGKARSVMHDIQKSLSLRRMQHNAPQTAQKNAQQNPAPIAVAAPSAPVRPPRKVVEYDNPVPEVSFAAREMMRRAPQTRQPNVPPAPEPAYR